MGSCQLQPQSSDLRNSYENHPTIMNVKQADRNVCMNDSLFVPSLAEEPLRRKIGIDGAIVPENSEMFLDLVWAFLS